MVSPGYARNERYRLISDEAIRTVFLASGSLNKCIRELGISHKTLHMRLRMIGMSPKMRDDERIDFAQRLGLT